MSKIRHVKIRRSDKGANGAPPHLLQFLDNLNKCFLTNSQSRFVSVVLCGVLEPLRLDQHTLPSPCISVIMEAM